jgi:hypothetical protein
MYVYSMFAHEHQPQNTLGSIHSGEEEGGPGLQRRPRHGVHPQVPPGEGLRGRGLRGRRGPTGGLPGDRRARPCHRREQGVCGGSETGLRDRVHLPGHRRECGVREPLPPGHVAGPPGHCPSPGGDRPQGEGTGRGSRCHGKGQRPGALRAGLRRAGPPARGHLAVEGRGIPDAVPGAHGPAGLRQGARHPRGGHRGEALFLRREWIPPTRPPTW